MKLNKDVQIPKQNSAATKKRILCVDDQPDICNLIEFILEEYEVISVNSIDEALTMIKKGKYSLYLMDFHLLDGTGFELCRLVKKQDTLTPILFVTGTNSITPAQTIKVGAQGLIKKSDLNFIEKLKSQVSKFALTF